MVCFILGGPGAGKGTQCDAMLRHFDIQHVSIGELLRAELEAFQLMKTSTVGESEDGIGAAIDKALREGKMLPGSITVALLKQEMERRTRVLHIMLSHYDF
jgi:UMP-CMP kinase